MKRLILIFLLITNIIFGVDNSCVSCHNGIEKIRSPHSDMMKEILKISDKSGNKGNDCIVCHGGNPSKMAKDEAHSGTIEYFKTNKGPKEFYPSPTSPWINKNTCGICHPNQVNAQMNSLMATEGGKIQGALWSFGGKNGYKHNIGDFNTSNPKDLHSRFGTDKYRKYMETLSKLEPQAFPSEMIPLPPAPTADEVEKDPSLAVYTYLRQECLRCHTTGKGRQKRGDFRGIGCASCHIPYSNSGLYEGGDAMIDKNASGHLLVHSIQSSRKVKVQVHDINYSGIPVETCSTCHNRGKRIGVSYQGLMESAYNATFDDEGNGQPKLHTKRYIHMQKDIHYQKGMLCQDCHTSNDMHGDGFLSGANAGAVEIECQDCHGTTKKYPWELPIGYSDEFSTTAKTGVGRGVTNTLAKYLKQRTVYPKKDGYLLSARGNPLPNVVKNGDKVTVHLASGKDIELSPLKTLKKEEKISKEGLVAMDNISSHTDNMECYTCHATWAPQCYGCHVKIDYSKGQKNVDWIKASHDRDIHGSTGVMKNLKDYLVDGKVTETRSFLRWESPPLAQNGEGRISPTVPGCQTTITVIGKDGKALLKNHIYKIKNVEGAGEEGQNAIDMAPIQPHTISKKSRTCEDCHATKKALGYGIGGSIATATPSKDAIAEIMSADGKILPKQYIPQINAIPNLINDYSKFLDENGTQLQTVGHHWSLSSPLNKAQRDKLSREGVCISCHIDIPKGNLAINAMSHIAKYSGVMIDNDIHQNILNKVVNLGAIVQIGLPIIFIILFVIWWVRRKKVNKLK